MKKNLVLICSLALSSLISCKQEIKYEFVDVNSDSLNVVKDKLYDLNNVSTGGPFAISGAANSQKNTWMAMLKGCYESDNLNKKLINNDLLYLGPSSNMYLGTIIDKRIVNNSFNVKTELKYLIPKSDFSEFAVEGESVNNCDLTKIKTVDFSLDAVLSGIIAQGMPDSLGAKINSYDSLTVTSGKWQIDYIRESDFIRYLTKNSNNPDIKYYADLVFNKKLRIVTKVVKVSGFQADALYKSGVSAGLSASLKVPITVSVANNAQDSEKDNDFSAKVTFKQKNQKEIHISTTNSFYVFGMIREGKQL
ncbi:hypothetical protein [Pedobacter sp. Leaf170]|uniref:hypothetical protein n=1 Tax=Pedobacter sp. Leaf170 TaxID=2876558 RepID=UPI001E531730|nr:hypothetical protein [Pedobacter sp. Leaf170]